ncbi:MAG TPA: PadR family transcriptional regulator [Pseudonocardiaceae bacterium]|jgi:DNA-binding PadR family transcriptional regulator|nr:PadR family transcriptional regulator [Pseudonocardiaceae bacterium]
MTRLLVLGVVRMYGQAHGYQVRTALAGWSADKWANAKPGSIYHALRRLAAEDLVAEVGTEEGGGGPERIVYRLTPAGDGEFQTLLRKALADPEEQALLAGLVFMTALRRQDLLMLLRARRRTIAATLATTVQLRDLNGELGKPAHVAELFGLWAETTDGELRWLDRLIERLAAGEYVLADDSPDHFAALRD